MPNAHPSPSPITDSFSSVVPRDQLIIIHTRSLSTKKSAHVSGFPVIQKFVIVSSKYNKNISI